MFQFLRHSLSLFWPVAKCFQMQFFTETVKIFTKIASASSIGLCSKCCHSSFTADEPELSHHTSLVYKREMPTSDLRFSAYLTSQPLYSYRDEAYAIDVKLGTPAQTLRLSVDLMRPGITVAGASCKNCAGANKRTYDGKKSSSSGCNTREYFIGNATAIECLDVIEVALSTPLYIEQGIRRSHQLNAILGTFRGGQ